MIVLKNVSKKFGDRTVLDRVSLAINPGEFVCVTGPSGAGKSTLLSLLLGAQDVSDGSVTVDGVDLRTVPTGALQIFRRKVGIMFQDYKLLKNRTVEENIAFPLEVCGIDDITINARTAQVLRRMNLSDRRKSLPHELSGGEKARTALARAIVHKPLIVLADEPIGNLDIEQARMVVDLLREINAEGTTVVVAAHDTTLMEPLRVRMVTLERGRLAKDTGPTKSTAIPMEQKRDAAPPEPEPPEDDMGHETISESADGDSVTIEEETKPKGQPPRPKDKKVRITSIHSD